MKTFSKGKKQQKRRYPLRRYKRKPKAKVPDTIKQYVKRTIHSQIENKQANVIGDNTISSWFGDVNMTCLPLMPVPFGTPAGGIHINQGVGQSDRVGNTIRTRNLVFKYILSPLPYATPLTPEPQPQEVKLFFGYLKKNRMTFPDVATFNNLYQFGNTSTSPFNNLWDVQMNVNTDLFHICKSIRHKVGNSVYTDFAGIKPQNYYSNNDFKLNCSNTVVLTPYLNKVLKFDDTSGVCDSGLYVWMTAVNADGTDSVFNTATVRIQWTLVYEYEDA